MSLLNDMLRDISQRQHKPEHQEGYDSLFNASSMSYKKQNAWLVPMTIFIVIFLLVLGMNLGWHYFLKTHKSVSVMPASVISTPVTAPPVSTEQKKATAGVSQTSTGNSVVVPHQAATAAQQDHINDLLLQADRAISMDRLTSPIEDNAYGYYQKILSLAPDNEAAKQGLENIATRYLAKAQEQQHLGNLQTMETYIQRARFVAPEFVREQLSVQMAADINLPVDNSPVEQGVAKNPQEKIAEERIPEQGSRQPLNEILVKRADAAQPTEPPMHETIKPFKVAEAAREDATQKLDVEPNAGWKDEQSAQQARDLLQQGKQTEAQALLKNALATQVAPVKSASLLVDIYMQQQNYEAAQIILTHAPYLSEATITRLNAMLLSAQGDNPGAIAMLEQHITTAEKDEDYRALLASLYHKTGNYRQSIISYQRLLSNFGEKPAYWLGLALAYDGLQQYKNALQAYLQLRQFAQLQPQVATYVDQRIAALRSQ